MRRILRALFGFIVLATTLVSAPDGKPRVGSLDAELIRIGERVELFWKEFSSISCVETVEQLKLSEKENIFNEKHSVYDYLILMQLIGNDLAVEESRELKSESKNKKKKRPRHRSLLITNGFAIMALVFHPHFQSSYIFRTMRDEVLEGRSLRRLDFEHVWGERSPSPLEVAGRVYELAWKGSAWIDPASGSVVRIRTRLKEPLTEVGLITLESEVQYGEVSFRGDSVKQWMPVRARIEARTEHQVWRNTHLFSDYQRFFVETEVTISDRDQKEVP